MRTATFPIIPYQLIQHLWKAALLFFIVHVHLEHPLPPNKKPQQKNTTKRRPYVMIQMERYTFYSVSRCTCNSLLSLEFGLEKFIIFSVDLILCNFNDLMLSCVKKEKHTITRGLVYATETLISQ